MTNCKISENNDVPQPSCWTLKKNKQNEPTQTLKFLFSRISHRARGRGTSNIRYYTHALPLHLFISLFFFLPQLFTRPPYSSQTITSSRPTRHDRHARWRHRRHAMRAGNTGLLLTLFLLRYFCYTSFPSSSYTFTFAECVYICPVSKTITS